MNKSLDGLARKAIAHYDTQAFPVVYLNEVQAKVIDDNFWDLIDNPKNND